MDPDLGDDFDADGHLTPAPRPPAVAARAVLPPELTLAAWTERTGIPSDALKERLRRGWTVERSLTEPVQNRGPGTRRRANLGAAAARAA